nr:8391_t:CDS:10 [Entrophospora candida]
MHVTKKRFTPKKKGKERYSKQELVGRGAYGSVYKGIDNETNEVVAIKVLNLDAEEDDVDDIIKEINLLSQLKHESQNITRYYGSFLHGTKLWIIMEYAAGGSIRTLMKSGRIEEKYISSITKEVLQALIYLHKCKIIHRDIKAANILLTAEGKVQLCDFGVAGQLTASSSKRTSFVGTPYWMAPEVIIEGATYDMKADIWSLGITVYEIATGNPPYHDQSAMRAIQLIPRNPPAQLEGPYSIPLKEFVSLCLNECPEQRPAADELIKCKFIKSISKHQNGILRDLIARFDLWKQTTGYRQSFSDPYGTPSSDSCDIGDNDDDEDAWIFDTVQNTANTAIHRKSHSLGSLASNLDKLSPKLSPKRYTYSRKYSENQHPLLQLFNNDDRKQDYNNSLFSNEHSENLFNSQYSSFSQSKNSFSMENGLTNNNNNNNLNKSTDSSSSILKNAQQTQGSNGLLLLSSVKPITNKEDSGYFSFRPHAKSSQLIRMNSEKSMGQITNNICLLTPPTSIHMNHKSSSSGSSTDSNRSNNCNEVTNNNLSNSNNNNSGSNLNPSYPSSPRGVPLYRSSSQGGRQYPSSHHARRVRSATTLNQTNRPNTEELIGQNSLGVYMQRQRATSIGGGNIQKSPKAKPIFAIQSSQIIKDGPELRQLKMDNYRGTNEVYEDLSKTTDDFLQWMLLLDAGINQLLTRF